MKYSVSSSLINGDMSQATLFSAPIDTRWRNFVAVSCSWTGTPTGTLQLLGSTLAPVSTLSTAQVTAGAWQPIGTTVQVTGAAGNTLYDVINTGCVYLAVLYTRTSGTGLLSVMASAKGAA